MLYYCGFDAFLQFKQKPDAGSYLHSLGDLILDNHDKIINAFIGWCSLFLQTGNGQILFLGYSKTKRQNSLTVCNEVPKYIINIECGAKETFLITLDCRMYRWSGFNFEKTAPSLVTFDGIERNSVENHVNDTDGATKKPIINAEHISVGSEFTCVLTDDRQAFLLDLNELKLIKSISDKNIQSISAGHEHILLLTEDGNVLSYGNGTRGQLGHGNLDNILDEAAKPIEALIGMKCKAIAAGGWHSMAISEAGDVYVWGWNESGQLGYSREKVTMETVPKLLEVSEDDNFMAISAGSRHSMAVSENGIVFGWGWNKYGQLGLDPKIVYFDSPNVIPFDHRVSNISCKFWSSLIETENTDSEST